MKRKVWMARAVLISLAAAVIASGCKTAPEKRPAWDPQSSENAAFLNPESKSKDLYHVLLTSDNYIVSQMESTDTIERKKDDGGDKYISSEIKKFDTIEEQREGVYSVWLYPDSGRISKIRPQQPTYLVEIDEVILQDLQRWEFKSPSNKTVYPTKFDVKYRVVLRKSLSDEEIIKQLRERMKEGS